MIQAHDYLVRVFEDQEEILHDRMDALKLARKFESPKLALPTIHTKQQEGDRREAWRNYEIKQREWKIVLATGTCRRRDGLMISTATTMCRQRRAGPGQRQ